METLHSPEKGLTMKIYAASDGNYGDAEGLTVLDTDDLGFPLGDIFDAVSDEDRAPLAQTLVENAELIRLSRSLLGTDAGEDVTQFHEYFRGQAELVRDMLGSALLEIEAVEVLLTLSPK